MRHGTRQLSGKRARHGAGHRRVAGYCTAVDTRNDAIGNLAVVVAAVLVWALSSSWPDLLVAFAVAGLFLQSAWSIIRDARSDLKQAGRA